jgi:transglutaminase-like putative cysteine protease
MRRILFALALTACAANAFAWGGAPDWVKQLAAQPLPSYPEGTKGVALLYETVTTVTDDGEIRSLHRRVYRILNTEGKELGVQSISYDGERPIRSLHAWSVTAKGEEYQIKDRDAVETAATDGLLYADNKIKVLSIPAADPGATVALEYEQRERPYSLQDSFDFQRDVPIRVARYTLVLPQGWSHEERWFNAPAVQPRPQANQLVWELKDVAPIKDEVGAPTARAVAGRMAINLIPPAELQSKSHRSWNDVAKWYISLAAPRRASTPAIAAKARELTANKTTTLDKLRALAWFAQRDIRYVAIEIGIGGYQPHAAGEVFTNRYGDCKDKATLLSALLREIGIESYYVLANTSRGEIDGNFATMTGFNHAVLAIKLPADVPPAAMPAVLKHPKLGNLLFFDPTDSTTPIGQLPTYLQENRVLVVANDGSGELVDVPAHPAEATHLAVTAKLALTTDGALDGEVREVRTGFLAARARADLLTMTEAERKKWLDRRLGYHLSQFSAKDLAIENLDDVTKDLVFRYHVTAPSYAKKAGPMLLVRPRVLGRKAESVVDLKERANAYVLDGPSLETDDVEISLPAGLVADELPEAASITSPAVTYTSAAKVEGNVLHYKREYKVSRFTVPLEGIPELNKVFTRILADERSNAVLKGK